MEILATVPVYTHPWIYNLLFAIAALFFIVGFGLVFSSIEFQSCTTLVIGIILIAIGIPGLFLTNNAMKKLQS